MRRPVNSPYTITTEFGVKDSYAKFGFHSGVDYAVPVGRSVYSPAAGTVVYARMHPTGGNMVVIHDGQYFHRLMHNSQFKIGEGQQVSDGQEVALAGTTGLSTGPHVHWDINTRGVDAQAFSDFVSPARWLNGEFVVARPAPALENFQRKVAEAGVNHREEANTSAPIRKEWAAGEILDFKGFVHGQSVNGNDIWFVGKYSGGYCWSGSFVDTSPHDLPDLTPAPIVDVKPLPLPIQYSEKPPIAGTWAIDISSHQRNLDFQALKEQGIEISILKAGHTGPSYGGNSNRTDPTLEQYQKDARAAGMAVGYYWYCYFDEDPETEAARFIQSIGSRFGEEPLFADVEEVNGANKAWLETFLETVHDLSGLTCHIYTYTSYLQNHEWLSELREGRSLWLAHYDIPAGSILTTHITPIMHQYTSKGVLRGVGSEYIDLNMYFGTVENFKKLGAIVPVVLPEVPKPVEPKEPLPNGDPPAPLPTKENNPVRDKVKAGATAGVIVTVIIGLANAFGISFDSDMQGALLTLVSALVTGITFIAAYMKRDGLSPK